MVIRSPGTTERIGEDTEQRLLPDPIHYPPIAGFGVTRSRRPCNSFRPRKAMSIIRWSLVFEDFFSSQTIFFSDNLSFALPNTHTG
jgi:hypothetical protein